MPDNWGYVAAAYGLAAHRAARLLAPPGADARKRARRARQSRRAGTASDEPGSGKFIVGGLVIVAALAYLICAGRDASRSSTSSRPS